MTIADELYDLCARLSGRALSGSCIPGQNWPLLMPVLGPPDGSHNAS